MNRHGHQTLEYPPDMNYSTDGEEVRRTPKRLPSGSQLPPQWNEGMDRAICYMYAQNEVDLPTLLKLLRRRFPELAMVSDSYLSSTRRLQ